jgi:outer membrane lipoprotein-sorting protein
MRRAGVTAIIGAFALSVFATSAIAQSAPMQLAPQAPAAPQTQPAPQKRDTRPVAPAVQPSAPPLAATAPFTARANQPGGFNANQRALIDRVSLYLSTIQTLIGDFVQVGPDGTRTEGQFFLLKPGKIHFAYNPPSVIEVVADGSSVVVRDRRLATQDLYPLGQTPLRFLLAERIDLIRDTTVSSISADDVFVTVVIEEKHAIVGTSRLMMMFGARDLQLRQWTVTDPQGYDTTVAVYNLDTTKRPPESLFKIIYDNNAQRIQ